VKISALAGVRTSRRLGSRQCAANSTSRGVSSTPEHELL
jgi:hypothetical protein